MQGRRVTSGLILIASLVVAITACDTDDGRDIPDTKFPFPPTTTVAPTTLPGGGPLPVTTPPPVPAMQLVTPWADGAEIPVRHTCDDLDVTPALSWANVPAGTVELALTMTDLTGSYTHWVLYGLDPTRTSLAEGELPTGSVQVANDFGNVGWEGPCPPEGDPAHTYLFTLHALNQQVEVADDAGSVQVVSILNQTSIVQSSVSGTYARPG